MTAERWSDERLGAALRTRAELVPTPYDLVESTVDAARREAKPIGWPARWPGLAAVFGAAAALLIVGVIAVSGPPDRRIGPSATPGASVLSVVTVAEAVEIQRSETAPREITVRGWFSAAPRGMRCPAELSNAINPVRLDCPRDFTWLLDGPAPLGAIRRTLPAGRSGLHPVFPGLDVGALTEAVEGVPDNQLVEVVLIGHFHDRRSHPALCNSPEAGACDSFVVDAIASIGGVAVPRSVVFDMEPWPGEPRHVPVWSLDEVHGSVRAAASGFEVLSTVVLPGARVAELEPGLGTGALEIIDRPVIWLVNGLDPGAGTSRLRSFLIVDGRPELAYEAVGWSESGVGFTSIDLALPEPPAIGPTPPASPSGGPPTVDFPSELLGLPVVSVEQALADADRDPSDTARVVAGYYIEPVPPVACPALPVDPEPIELRCPDTLRWLMERPQVPWTIADGVREFRAPDGPALHPLIGPEVAFHVGLAPADEPRAIPVVVLGHFGDWRGNLYVQRLSFVVDALLWADGRAVDPEPVVLDAVGVTDAGVVQALIDAKLGPARASWPALLSRDRLQEIDPSGVVAFESATAVWRVRRLVERDGRTVVRSAFVIDGDDRIWWEASCGGCPMLQVTHRAVLDVVHDVDLEVFDSSGTVVDVRAGGSVRLLPSVRTVPGTEFHPTVSLMVVGTAPSELWIDWVGGMCDSTWSLMVFDDRPSIHLSHPPVESCRLGGVNRGVVVTFDRPIDVNDVDVVHVLSGG